MSALFNPALTHDQILRSTQDWVNAGQNRVIFQALTALWASQPHVFTLFCLFWPHSDSHLLISHRFLTVCIHACLVVPLSLFVQYVMKVYWLTSEVKCRNYTILLYFQQRLFDLLQHRPENIWEKFVQLEHRHTKLHLNCTFMNSTCAKNGHLIQTCNVQSSF